MVNKNDIRSLVILAMIWVLFVAMPINNEISDDDIVTIYKTPSEYRPGDYLELTKGELSQIPTGAMNIRKYETPDGKIKIEYDVVNYNPAIVQAESYRAPVQTPVPTISNDYIFDIDIGIGIVFYKKGDCIITAAIDTSANEESGICTDDDWYNFRKEIKKIKPIVVTPVPTPVPMSTPVPTSIPTASTDKPFENPWDFVEYVQNNWVYESDNGKVVQEPEVYFKLLSGDCDDFATMVAYYLQEVYGYDTLVATVQLPKGPHLVAFWYLEQSTIDTIAQQCGTSIPTITKNGRTYAAIDWEICTEWTWTGTGTITTHEWSYYVGKTV